MLDNKITFFVPGIPYAKQSFRYNRTGGYGYQKQGVKDWQSTIAQHASISYRDPDPATMPLYVKLVFNLAADRADLDNLAKAVNDGLQGVIFHNDKQIRRMFLEKKMCKENPGVTITIAKYRG